MILTRSWVGCIPHLCYLVSRLHLCWTQTSWMRISSKPLPGFGAHVQAELDRRGSIHSIPHVRSQAFDIGAGMQISHQCQKNPIVFKIEAGLSRALDLKLRS